DYVAISETRIAAQLGVSELAVTTALLTLSRMHVIHYIPRRLTPYVYYPTSRELPRYLVIPRSVYEEQRARYEARLDAIKRFAFSDDCCRSRIMLEYFGETDTKDCGVCDVCRERKRLQPSADDQVTLAEDLCRRLASGTHTLEQLAAIYPTHRQLLADTIRSLSEEGKITLTGNRVDLIN
ncbi:MAG: RecQ family zinc-binding domain-containing protein, partial [Muribaculaceae bacterium]|nr:RecQ family zinc-binding domain-containing protein [Muribaculaceae bacterium]